MKKTIIIIVASSLVVISIALIAVFGFKKDKSKPVTGIDPVFSESLGFNNDSGCIIETDDSTRYIFYSRNETAFDDTTESIAVKKGVLKKGVWVYDNKPTTVLNLSSKGWDTRHIYAPSVVKGAFSYQGDNYSYLMAYAGNSVRADRSQSQIGLAVAKTPNGKWTKVGNSPVISFNKYDYDELGLKTSKGATDPSLISYDFEGKVYLFYSFFEPTVISAYAVEMDVANLDDLKLSGRIIINNEGLSDGSTYPSALNAGWAYNKATDEYYIVRDYYPLASSSPVVASGVQIAKGTKSVIYSINESREETDSEFDGRWTIVDRQINSFDTVDFNKNENSTGYDRVYSADFVTDAYGYFKDDKNIEILFTSSATMNSEYLTDNEYKFSSALHIYKVI